MRSRSQLIQVNRMSRSIYPRPPAAFLAVALAAFALALGAAGGSPRAAGARGAVAA
jgi:hypothetical protein